MLLLSGAAWAQTAPEPGPQAPDDPGVRRVFPPGYRVEELRVDQVRDLFSSGRFRPQTDPCAIPLTRVPIQPETSFSIERRNPQALPPMSRVRPPAPPCSPEPLAVPDLPGETRIDPDLVDEVRRMLEEQAKEESDEPPDSPAEPIP